MIRLGLVLTAISIAGCGSDPETNLLTLADTYDVIGVARVLPDGVAATELTDFAWTLRALRVQGGAVTGVLAPKDRTIEIPLMGEIDGATGNFSFVPFEAALTSTASESVEQIGGTGFDGAPKNSIADDMTGFVKTRRGARVHQGFWIAASNGESRPPVPDKAKISANRESFGVAKVIGMPGAAAPTAQVELFVYFLAPGDPRFTTTVTRDDGSFEATVDALEGDHVIVRLRKAGIAGDGVSLAVGPG
jgi:hypothetical protein